MNFPSFIVKCIRNKRTMKLVLLIFLVLENEKSVIWIPTVENRQYYYDVRQIDSGHFRSISNQCSFFPLLNLCCYCFEVILNGKNDKLIHRRKMIRFSLFQFMYNHFILHRCIQSVICLLQSKEQEE